MLFNSYEFIFAFLPIVFLIYFYLMSKRLVLGAKAFLVFSSLFFYAWWSILYLPILLSTLLFNYIIGKTLTQKEFKKSFSKKSVLIFGIVANLSLLGYFHLKFQCPKWFKYKSSSSSFTFSTIICNISTNSFLS